MLSGFPTPQNVKDYAYPIKILEELQKEIVEINYHKPTIFPKEGIGAKTLRRDCESYRKSAKNLKVPT